MNRLSIKIHGLERIVSEAKGVELNKIASFKNVANNELRYPLLTFILMSGCENYHASNSSVETLYQVNLMFEFRYAKKGLFVPSELLPEEFTSVYHTTPCALVEFQEDGRKHLYKVTRRKDEFTIGVHEHDPLPLSSKEDELAFGSHIKNIVVISEALINHNYENYYVTKLLGKTEPYAIHIMPKGHNVETNGTDMKLIVGPGDIPGRVK